MVRGLGLWPYGRGGQGSLPCCLCEPAQMPLALSNNIAFCIQQNCEGWQCQVEVISQPMWPPAHFGSYIRASLQKINSYSWLPDDLYGLQALNLTPHLLQKYFFRLSQPSVSVRKTDYLYRSEELRVCVSTSIREAIMGHAWNVMVSASPP